MSHGGIGVKPVRFLIGQGTHQSLVQGGFDKRLAIDKMAGTLFCDGPCQAAVGSCIVSGCELLVSRGSGGQWRAVLVDVMKCPIPGVIQCGYHVVF